MSTKYDSYDQVPWYRKWWFAAIGCFVFMPAIIIMAFTGNFYYLKKGQITAFSPWYKFVLSGWLFLAIAITINQEKPSSSEEKTITREELQTMFENAMKDSKPIVVKTEAEPVEDAHEDYINDEHTETITTLIRPVADGPAALRCGWIENTMPSSLTLHDRDGTWLIFGASDSGMADPDGFEQMPSTDRGTSCGCLKVETNRQSMQIVKILDGSLKPVSACSNDKALR
jgi:hypothetical protein